MPGKIVLAFVCGFSALSLAGCVTNPFEGSVALSKTGSTKDNTPDQEQAFTQFQDIPIPQRSEIDLEKSLVLGNEGGWIGRLSIYVPAGMTELYAFYETEMPKFGWKQITTVRSAISTLTYRREKRVATVTLQERLTRGSNVDYTVGPANEKQ